MVRDTQRQLTRRFAFRRALLCKNPNTLVGVDKNVHRLANGRAEEVTKRVFSIAMVVQTMSPSLRNVWCCLRSVRNPTASR